MSDVKIDNLRVATWSHSTYKDVWPMYFGQLNQNAPGLKHCLVVDKDVPAPAPGCRVIVNNENDPYYKRFVESFKKIDEEHVMYMQEDFILYDKADMARIEGINSFLKDSPYSFIRMLKSGVAGGPKVHDDLNLFEIPREDFPQQYIFSYQGAIWKKKDLVKLFEHFKPSGLIDGEKRGTGACLQLGIRGCYVYNNERKRGNLHYDSEVFPYVSTAIHKGKWILSPYESIMNALIKTYNIDPSIRGTF